MFTYTNTALPNCLGSDTASITVENCTICAIELNSEQSAFTIYPNPSDGRLHATINKSENEWVVVSIKDVWGKTITTEKLKVLKGELSIDVCFYPTGFTI